jgi:hypothetical protein
VLAFCQKYIKYRTTALQLVLYLVRGGQGNLPDGSFSALHGHDHHHHTTIHRWLDILRMIYSLATTFGNRRALATPPVYDYTISRCTTVNCVACTIPVPSLHRQRLPRERLRIDAALRRPLGRDTGCGCCQRCPWLLWLSQRLSRVCRAVPLRKLGA